jgi:hypothetical protein
VSDRADELRRQRDLLREHLDWIERELANELGASRPEPQVMPRPVAPQPLPFRPAPVDDRDAEAILAEYRTPPMSIAARTKFGCVAYFVIGMALLGAAVAAFYFYVRAVRGH